MAETRASGRGSMLLPALSYQAAVAAKEGQSMANLSRNAQVLRYLLQVAPGIGHTKLAKFAYLADLESRRYLGRPISGFTYYFDQHGPFDSSGFFGALAELKTSGFITENQIPCGEYVGYEMLPTSQAPEFDFSQSEAEVLRYVATTYLSKTARDLCDDIVYKTEPMLNAEPGRPLPMDRMNRVPGKDLSFSLERMLAGEASVAQGRTRPWAELMDELRTAGQ